MPEPRNAKLRPYHPPELRVHGTVEELTRFNPSVGGDDGIYGQDQVTPPTS
ncbi:MAG TPA: lasso RiPP family leader peptide-containing protein [Gemmatimonadales bacterium]|nr:lasso RiPP family leader peptide-containing protein [Gemmatimonadales bacterium]